MVIKRLLLLGLCYFSTVHLLQAAQKEQTLYISPTVIQMQEQRTESKEKQKPVVFYDIHNVLFAKKSWSHLHGFLSVENKGQTFWQALCVLASSSYRTYMSALRKEKNKVTEAYIQPLEQEYPALYKCVISWYTHIYQPDQAMQDHIQKLTANDHKAYLLSNIGPRSLEALKEANPGSFTTFQHDNKNVINTETPQTNVKWLSKPHKAAYQEALRVAGMTGKAHFCIFVDDNEKNIKAAVEECDMNGIVYKNAEQFKEDLATLTARLQSASYS